MRLCQLEVRNFRSIREQDNADPIVFKGLDCLVGKNNNGKTNVISAIRYLLGEERKPKDDELYWQRNTDKTVEIRGFFEIEETDLERVDDDSTREKIEERIIQSGEPEGTIGVCRVINESDEGRSAYKIIRDLPADDHLNRQKFINFRNKCWDEIGDGNYTKTNYRDDLQEKYERIAELVPEGQEKNKGDWKNAYDKFVKNRPEDVEFKPQPEKIGDLKTPIFEQILPRVIDIPASKQVDDATRTSNTGEFGELLSELSGEIQEDIDERIQEKLKKVHSELNPVGEQDRLESVNNLEQRITDYVSETFSNHSISLRFPQLKSDDIFNSANIKMEENHLEEPLSTENVGQGVKRTLIFSLVRTLADINSSELSFGESAGVDKDSDRPLLVLYEEAELFLHPSLQKILLGAFEQLQNTGNQVVFSTHSPVLVQSDVLKSINIVRKQLEKGTQTTQFHRILDNYDQKTKMRLTQLQNVSSYIFADKVVLVEGDTDKLVLKKLGPILNSEWNFEHQEIPVLDVGGKYELKSFKSLLEGLGLDTYIMADVDAIRGTISELSDNSNIQDLQSDLKQKAEELAEQGLFDARKPKKAVEDIRSKGEWNDRVDDLKEMEEILCANEEPTKEHLRALRDLIEKVNGSGWKKAITSDHEDIKSRRIELCQKLLQENILLLQGEIEDYYDGSKNKKRKSAIEFSSENTDVESLNERFTKLPESGEYDMKKFLESIF